MELQIPAEQESLKELNLRPNIYLLGYIWISKKVITKSKIWYLSLKNGI